MKRDIEFYKQLEQLTYSVYNVKKFPVPPGWESVRKFENKKTGFYAEAFKNSNGEIFLVPRATQFFNGCGFDYRDLQNDYHLFKKEIPAQLRDLESAYWQLKLIYGDTVKTAGYSLGGTLSAILGNETGIETITFEAYGVGDFIKPKYTQNIINFGNEKDRIFTIQLDNQLGNVFIIPSEKDFDPFPHLPNAIGDISNAYMYKAALDGKVIQSKYSDDIFNYSNKVFYKGERFPIDEIDKAGTANFWDQALEKGGLPSKEDLDVRLKSGELIYVENYTRSDGTKVSGYYRRNPQK